MNVVVSTQKLYLDDLKAKSGIWFSIMEVLAKLAVISNAFLIAFTSDFIQKLVYKFEYGERGVMRGYVMFTLSKSPVKNWIAKGQVKLCCFELGFKLHMEF